MKNKLLMVAAFISLALSFNAFAIKETLQECLNYGAICIADATSVPGQDSVLPLRGLTRENVVGTYLVVRPINQDSDHIYTLRTESSMMPSWATPVPTQAAAGSGIRSCLDAPGQISFSLPFNDRSSYQGHSVCLLSYTARTILPGEYIFDGPGIFNNNTRTGSNYEWSYTVTNPKS